MESGVYYHSITVKQEDLDDLNHVNNVVYVQWVQDAAAAHWEKLATADIHQKYFWVVLRHEIDYTSAALLGDALDAATWVETAEGVKSDRTVEIRRKKDDKLLVKARTTWCLMSRTTQRPIRIGDDLRELFTNSKV